MTASNKLIYFVEVVLYIREIEIFNLRMGQWSDILG